MTVALGAARSARLVEALPAVASRALAGLLDGPVQPLSVLGTPRGATYLRTASGDVLAVVGPGVPRLPMAVVLGADPCLPRLRPATIGGGHLRLGEVEVRAVRWWDPRPVLSPADRVVLAANVDRLAGLVVAPLLAPVPQSLAAAVRGDDGELAGRAARSLAGLGPGLTPAGDDVLVGLLSALSVLGGSPVTLDAVRAAAYGRTTDLSLALLRHAAAGECIDRVGGLLQALAGYGEVEPAYRRLAAVGHSSGPALAAGVLIGAAGAVPG